DEAGQAAWVDREPLGEVALLVADSDEGLQSASGADSVYEPGAGRGGGLDDRSPHEGVVHGGSALLTSVEVVEVVVAKGLVVAVESRPPVVEAVDERLVGVRAVRRDVVEPNRGVVLDLVEEEV